MKNSFKYIDDGTTAVLYHNSSMNFYRVYDNNIKNTLRDFFVNNKSSSEALKILKDTSNDIDNEQNDKEIEQSNLTVENDNKKPKLHKLVLIVTNDCNFRCKYCYAHGGSYGLPVENMTIQEAQNIIDSFIEKYISIDNVQMFGGEPLLNYDVLKFVCEYFKQLNLDKKINYMPDFGIVTNGTCFTQKAIKLMKDFNFSITFSMDGSSIIHNKLRPDRLGNGTFNKVKENYFNLLNGDVFKGAIAFECTYTQEHINNNISIVDLLKFFRKEFNSLIVHITPVAINKSHNLSLYDSRELFRKYIKDAVCYTFDKILNEKIINSIPIIISILERIINKRPIPYICPAGISTLSVTHDGNITPCFIFTGKDVSVGTLNSDINTIVTNLDTFINKHNLKEADSKCSHCWARYICTTCLAGIGEDLENKDKTYGLDIMCDTIQTILETMLIKISELKASENKWNEFKEVIFEYGKSK